MTYVDLAEFQPTQDDLRRREEALARAWELFPEVEIRMREVYGLRLPRHIAIWAACVGGLSRLEDEGLNELGWSPGGIMIWFEPDGLERVTRDGLDPRLELRFRRDPPELVSIAMGNSDGQHFGLWYDDPAELPSFVVENYARDDAWTREEAPTFLRGLEVRLTSIIEHPDYPEEPTPVGYLALLAAVRWFAKLEDEALEAEPLGLRHAIREEINGGIGPVLPKEVDESAEWEEDPEERLAAYRARSDEVDDWIQSARGDPALALILGRELHWFNAPEYDQVALELLEGAYEALGRQALADIARVHYANRSLSMAAAY